MKTLTFTILMVVSLCCTAQDIKNLDLFFLIDVTDRELFQIINTDIQTNLPVFFKNTKFADIHEHERFTLHVAPIAISESLELSSASICIPRKGLSYSAENQLKNPKPIVLLLKKELTDYDILSMKNYKTTNILNIFIKAIIQADPESFDSWYFIFSDLLENNKYINLYKGIPECSEIPTIINNVDPYLLNKLNQKIDSGFEPNIVIVLKSLPNSKVDPRTLRTFWSCFFKELGFFDVQFIDNLSNSFAL